MLKRYRMQVLLVMVSLAVCCLPSPARASASSTVVKLWVGNPVMAVGTTRQAIDAEGTQPVIVEGRTLVPIRVIIEAFHGSVVWDATERKVMLSLGKNELTLWIDKPLATLNGTTVPIDVANSRIVPLTMSGRTMLPVRFVTESLGVDVQYEAATKMITLTYSRSAPLLALLDQILHYLPLIAAVVGGAIFLVIYVGLSGQLQLSIVPQWVNNDQQVILHLEAANHSKVRVWVKQYDGEGPLPGRVLQRLRCMFIGSRGLKQDDGSICIAIEEYDLGEKDRVRSRMLFPGDDLKESSQRQLPDSEKTATPKRTIGPVEVFTSTQRIWVGYTVSDDYVHQAAPNTFLHVGLQFKAPATLWTRLHFAVRGTTTACFTFPPGEKDSVKAR